MKAVSLTKMLASLFVFASSTLAMGEARFPDIARDQLTEAQKHVYDAIASGPRGGVRGPFGPLLRSPELTERV